MNPFCFDKVPAVLSTPMAPFAPKTSDSTTMQTGLGKISLEYIPKALLFARKGNCSMPESLPFTREGNGFTTKTLPFVREGNGFTTKTLPFVGKCNGLGPKSLPFARKVNVNLARKRHFA